MSYQSASFSAEAPSEIVHRRSICGLTIRQPSVVECSVSGAAGNALAGLSSTHGARVMDSTPPATTTDRSPAAIARDPWIAASSEEPQSRLTATPVTLVGRPASKAAMRATGFTEVLPASHRRRCASG